jgi:hypothetical protein
MKQTLRMIRTVCLQASVVSMNMLMLCRFLYEQSMNSNFTVASLCGRQSRENKIALCLPSSS